MKTYAAYVGIDWSSDKHDIQARIGDKLSYAVVPHDRSAIEEYFEALHEEAGGPIAVCLEQSRGPLINVLSELPYAKLYPTNPAALAKYRKAFALSGAKADPSDAALCRNFIDKHEEVLREKIPQDEATERLDLLTRFRRDAVDDRTQLSNKLTDALKQYFPEVLKLFDELYAAIAVDFLEQWKSLQEVKTASDEQLLQFFQTHHSTKPQRNNTRLKLLREAQPLTSNQAIIESCKLHVQRLCSQMRELNKAIAQFDREIAGKVVNHPDYAIFSSFPAAGAVTCSRLIAAFGTDRSRFGSAEGFVNYHGISPIKVQSGKFMKVVARVAKPKFSHQSLVEWAGLTIPVCPWAKQYYAKKRAKGSDHRVAVRALAFKWCRILYACWMNETPYNGEFKKNLSSAA